MFLPDSIIKRYLKEGKISVYPSVRDEDIRPVGIRLHLANEILVPKSDQIIDLLNPLQIKYDTISITKGYILKPGDFILASTRERIQTEKDIISFIDGRSTIARLGLTIHISSQVVDGNHDEKRSITLEIKNIGNISVKIYAKYPIAMIYFAQLMESVSQNDQSQYTKQIGATPPNLEYKTGVDR